MLPSLNVPTATNVPLVFTARVGFDGLMASEIRLASVTVSCVLPLTEPETVANDAVIVVVPLALPVATPLFVVTTATLVTVEAQVQTVEMS